MAWIEQRGDSWRVVWRNQGQRQSATWPDEDTAQQAKDMVEAHRHKLTGEQLEDLILGPVEADPDAPPPSSCPLLRDWVAEWLPSRTRPSPRTAGEYAAMWEQRILPALGHLHMDHISGVDVGRFIHDLRTTPAPRAPHGLSERRVTKYFSEVSAAYAAAIKARKRTNVIDNPCHESDFRRGRVGHDESDDAEGAVYLTPDEYRRLRDQFAEHYRPLLDVLVGTGARWSEATAVSASAITADGRRRTAPPSVRIYRAWKKDQHGRRYLGSTKGRSRRSVPIAGWLAGTIAELVEVAPAVWRDWQALTRRQAEVPPKGRRESASTTTGREHARRMLTLLDEPLLLTTPSGGPYEYMNFLRQVWNPAVVQAMRCPTHPPPSQGGPVPDGVDAGVLCKDHGGVTTTGRPCAKELRPGMTRCTWHMGPAPDAVSDCDCPGVLHQRLTPHDLRHTFASWYLHGGGHMRRLQELLGHESITTTEIYSGLLPGSEDAVVAALDATWDADGATDEPTP